MVLFILLPYSAVYIDQVEAVIQEELQSILGRTPHSKP